jgi:hypothetical protein
MSQRDEATLPDPVSVPMDPIERAIWYGIDLTLLKENLRRTPTERLERHKQALKAVEAIRKAARKRPLNVSAATVELVKGILALYPQAQLVPRVTPLENEEISVEVRLPVSIDEIYRARDRVHELVIQLQEQYDVLILASAVPA